MKVGRASRTAEHNALFRALEASRSQKDRLFDDPLASVFLTWPLSLVDKCARRPALHALITRFIDHRWPGVRPSVIARTRLIDDAIVSSLDGHIEQFVILGSGFDSRPYRLHQL